MARVKWLGSTHSIVAPITKTLCLLSERNSLQMDSTQPPTPIDFNLNKRPLWLTLSKSVLKSSWTIYDSIPATKDFWRWQDMVSSASVQPRAFLSAKWTAGKKNISRKSWRACEKLTSHTPLTEWGLLIWVGRFPYQGNNCFNVSYKRYESYEQRCMLVGHLHFF